MNSLNPQTKDEPFYVGHFPNSPKGLAKHTIIATVLLAVMTLSTIGVVALSQNPIDPGLFEFGIEREFEGLFSSEPIPTLSISSPDHPDGIVSYLLVGQGKAGVSPDLLANNGHTIRLKGSLIERENMTMIEVADTGAVEIIDEPRTEVRPATRTLGEVTLRGEIVDTKCFFGVMRPATGKVHRACAIRCLEGGVPPGLLVKDEQGNGVVFMLAFSEESRKAFDTQWAALEAKVEGNLELDNNIPIIRVKDIHLLDESRSDLN